jgi:hypothetical protein
MGRFARSSIQAGHPAGLLTSASKTSRSYVGQHRLVDDIWPAERDHTSQSDSTEADMSVDSITVVNDSITMLRRHLPAVQDPAARMLYDTIGAALHRQGKAHLLNDIAGNEPEVKRVLRQAVRDEPQLGVALGHASAAVRSIIPPQASAPPTPTPFAPTPLPAALTPPASASTSPSALPSAAVPFAASAAPPPVLRRKDLAAALDATPGPMRHQILGAAARCVELVDTNLPEDEEVLAVASASVRPDAPENCLLILTNSRVIFVAPKPQVVAYKLTALARSQAFSGYFFLEDAARKHSVGLRGGPWSEEFEQRVDEASALAVLAGR